MDIIKGKTASLLAAACAAGAASVTDSQDAIKRMESFGMYLGMAFQIKDDLLDMEGSTGKTRGQDLLDRKLTLPVIYALSHSEMSDRKQMQRLIAKKKKTRTELHRLFDWIAEKGGVEYAREKMLHYRTLALSEMEPLEDSESKAALAQLCYYVTDRKK